MRRLLSLGFVFVGMAGAYGQSTGVPPQVANNAGIAAEFTATFSNICLDTFPDSAGVDAAVAQKSAVPLTQDQVKVGLHGDAGKGWLLKGSSADFTILITTAPVRSCAVRLTTNGLFTPGATYSALEGFFAAEKGLKIQPGTLAVREPSDHYATTITNTTTKPDGSKGDHVFLLTKDYFTDPHDPKKLLSLDTELVHQILSPD